MVRRLLAALCAVFALCAAAGCTSGSELSGDYASAFKDGTYTVSSAHRDSYGYTRRLTIAVRRGIITDVSILQTDAGGTNRLPGAATQKWERCSETYAQILEQLYRSTIITQGSKIDTVAGATQTCSDYKALLAAALESAKAGAPAERVIDIFSDSFTAVNAPDSAGAQERLSVVYTDGVLTKADCREVTNNTAFYTTGRVYSALAAVTEKNGDLNDLTPADLPDDASPDILMRYNALLAQIRAQREL